MGPGKHLQGKSLFGGIVKPEEFDYFHEMVINQELARVQARGYGDGFQAGTVIGLPPVLNYANPTLKKEIVDACFSGKKNISLAISEAFVGSDVAGMRTRATKSDDGKYYTINGAKKWITGGMHAHYFTVGTKTDKGLTVFLVPRQEGVETRPIKTAYSAAAGTAYVTFKDVGLEVVKNTIRAYASWQVKVPVENMLGKENEGIKVIRESAQFDTALDADYTSSQWQTST
jgi:alkylation response protein AidB-like acyl-CoA dehydrogenase